MSKIYRLDTNNNWVEIGLTASSAEPLVFTYPGTLAAGLAQVKFPVWKTITVTNVRAIVGATPSSGSITVDIYKNGTTSSSSIFTGSTKPIISSGTSQSLFATPAYPTLNAGDHVMVNIDSVGSIIPGSDLCLVIEYI